MKFLLIVLLCYLYSCSHYRIDRDSDRDIKSIGQKDFELDILFDDDDLALNKEQLTKWIVEGINESVGADEKLTQVFQGSGCQVSIEIEDDEHSWSSWKPYVSGGTLGIIPVKFNYLYRIKVEGSNGKKEYDLKGESWKSLIFVPFFLATNSYREMNLLVGKETRVLIGEACW